MKIYSNIISTRLAKPKPMKHAFMRFCFILTAFICTSQVYAQTNIHLENANLEQVLKEIGKKNDYQLFYNSKTAQNIKGITLQLDNVSVNQILDQALKGTNLGYAITGKTIVIRQQNQSKNPIEISGTVTDKNKEPLIGASVIIQGTTLGVSTDVNGRFSLKVPANAAAITVTFIGYQNKNVAIMNTDKPQVFNIVLEEDTKQMEEVVVTGYQTISKERATGSFAKVGSETLELRRMDNLSNMLEGQVAGYTNGQIRGITTMNAVAQPLVVIDGFPVENTTYDRSGTTENMPDLNPEDIESITVLKDAAAASIYGARAANGVIVITTKKAKQGKTEVNASATFTINPYYFYTKNLTNSADIVDIQREWAQNNQALQTGGSSASALAGQIYNDGALPSAGVDALLKRYTGVMSPDEADAILNNLASQGYSYYDQVKKYTKQNPFYQQYNVRIAKTTDQNSFSASATYWRNRSEDINTQDDKLSLNVINSLKITKWLRFDAGIYLKYGKGKKQTYDPLNPGFSFLPYDRLVADDGTYVDAVSQNKKDVRDNIAQYGMYDEIITPMDEIGYRIKKSKDLNTRVYGKLKLDFTSWLNYDIMFQYETSQGDMNTLGEKESYFTQSQINKFSTLASDNSLVYNLPNGNTYSTQSNNTTAYNFRQQLNLNKTFAEKHNVVWIFGNETRSTLMKYETNTLYGYDPKLLTWNNIDAQRLASGVAGINGVARLSVSDIAQKGEILNRFVSIYSNLAYTYNDRYAFSGSIRWDRSNLWGSNIKNQNKPLWSVGGSWLINKEDFFHIEQLDLLKLRVSYGIGGNIGRNTAPYLIAQYFTDYFTGMNGGLIKSLPNADIRWEKTATTNIGVDFAAFNNRLSGSIEYYNKYSTDLLAQINNSPTSGMSFGTTTTNNGKMTNRGIELTLKGDIFRTESFKWTSTLLYAYNKNKVKAINITPTSTDMLLSFPNSYPTVGQPYNGIHAYKWAGLDSNGDPQIYGSDGKITTGPVSSSDVNALYYCGTSTPIHSGTFTNVLTYKNFELSAMLLFETGHKIRETNIPDINMTTGRITRTSKDITRRWKNAGDENKTDVPRLLFSDSDGYNSHRYTLYANSDLFVYDASNIRLRNISLSYRLPQQICQRLMMSGVKFQFNVENVATLAFDKKASYALGAKVKPNYVFAVNLNF